MQVEDVKKKGMKGIKTIIFGRTLIVVFAFIIQFFLLFACFNWLRDYSTLIFFCFIILGVLVVLALFNGRGNPDFKLVWMLPVLVVPVFGALFYVFLNNQPGTSKLYKRLQHLNSYTRKYARQDEKIAAEIAQKDPLMGRFCTYLNEYGSCPVYAHTRVTYFPLGDDQFPVMLEQLKKAKSYIFMEYFILEEGYMWESILEILKQKVKEGVEVRVMYDGFCSLALLPHFYPLLLEKEGIHCKMFSPIKPLFSTSYNNRDHRKILVIDGEVGFTGGTNLSDEYINKKERFGHWKDTAVMIRGEAVERFTLMFLEMWGVTEKGVLSYEPYLSPKNMQISNDGYVIPYDVTPYGTERVGKQMYLDILNTAKKYVHIMTPYLILDYQMVEALTYTAKKGVEVRIIMPHIPDKKTAFLLAKTYYNELMEAGVEIFEYKPGFVHAKVFVSDDEKAVVGTVNLDYRSLYHHFECGLFFYRNSQIQAVEKDYQMTLKKCLRMSEQDYKKLSFGSKMMGKILRVFAPLM